MDLGGRRSAVSRRFLADAAALVFLAAAVALFFWRLWAPNPADRVAFPVGDFTNQYYPLRHFVAATLARGDLPFWNPFIYGGQPGLADPQAAALYPPAVLNAWLWGPDFPLIALELEVVAHILLAAWGAYAFVRSALSLGVRAALAGAIVFGFSGYLTGFPLQQVTILESAAWLPWLLLAAHHASGPSRTAPNNGRRTTDDGRRIAWLALAALLFGVAILAGHPQTALYLGYTLLAYGLFRLGLPRRGALRHWLSGLFAIVLMLLLGLALAAAQLLPTQAFIAESSRAALNYGFARTGLVWEELVTAFLPQLAGSNPLYAGIGAVALALVSAIWRPESERLREAWVSSRFWLGAALASVLLGLGGNSFLFDLVYLGVPGFARVRSQERILLLFAWALALFAAWGLAALSKPGGDQVGPDTSTWLVGRLNAVGRWLPALVVPLLFFWWLRAFRIAGYAGDPTVLEAFYGGYVFFVAMVLANWALLRWGAGRRLVPLLLLGLLLFDLFTVNRNNHIGLPVEETVRAPADLASAAQAAYAQAPARFAVVGEPPLRGNDGMLWDLPLLEGNEPLRLGNSGDFLGKVEPWRQFQLLHVGYVIADRDLAVEAPTLYETVANASGAYLVRLRVPGPYAWVVGQTEVLRGGRSEIRDRLNDPTFDPLTTVLFNDDRPAAERPVAGEVTVEERAPGFVRLHASADADAILLVAEPHADGWVATIAGQPARVRQANIINLGIELPAGDHLVTLRYEQPGWRSGLYISAAALVMVSLLLLWGLLRPRPRD